MNEIKKSKYQRRMERIKSDPERYKRYLEKAKDKYKKKREKLLNEPEKLALFLEKNRVNALKYYHTEIRSNVDKFNELKEYNKQYQLKIKGDKTLNQKLKERHKADWIKNGYNRMRRQVFRRLARYSNKHYKTNLIAPADLWRIAKKQRLICPFTGQKLTIDNMSVDHIIPKSKGGLNIPSNIRLTLKSVNVARSNMTDNEFLSLCKDVVMNYCNPPILR